MKSSSKILAALISLSLFGLFLLLPLPNQTEVTPRRAPQTGTDAPAEAGYIFQNSVLGRALNGSAQAPNQQGPTVGEPVTPHLSPAVRDLPPGDREPVLNRETNPRQNPDILNVDPNNRDPYDTGEPDPLLNRSHNGRLQTPAVITSFEGISLANGGGGFPPDTVGDVGPNHYVQMVNVAFRIFDKNGTSLVGPTNINQLWQGEGGQCEIQNAGDPIVLYDRQVDRWLLSQFFSNGLCIAISQTPDPTGAYYLYTFPTTNFPDYFKFGVWSNAYYMGSNEGSYAVYAFDRTNMLIGATAQGPVRFGGGTNFLMPADLDGSTPPPANSPGLFYTFKDNAFHGGNDRLEVYEFSVDFDTPGNSTFTLVDTINITGFTYTVCGFFVFSCIPQPGVTEKIDAVSEWPMWRLQYRNFGAYQTLVSNFAIDVGSDQAGIRWFELRKTAANWELHQEGTHAPDSDNRFMGSIAMDQSGNMALGYSVSSSSTFPAIRYATRNADDTTGTLQTEAVLINGSASQSGGFSRWGDYSSMNVDPADDCTFWYTSEYLTNTANGWQTRIGSFKVPSCGPPALTISKTGQTQVAPNDLITYTLTVTNSGPAIATNLVITDTLPDGASYVSGGTLSGNNVVSFTLDSLAANGGTVERSFTVTATETIINDDYAVTADSGVNAIGTTIVTTNVTGGSEIYLPLVVK